MPPVTAEQEERLRWERNVLARARRGDVDAIGALYDMYAARLYECVLLPKLGSRAAADDALAETFEAMMRRLDSFEDRGDGIWPWLVRIAQNKALDVHRARGRSGKALDAYASMLRVDGGDVVAFRSAAELDRDREAARARVDEGLTAISPRYRRAIELRFVEERSRDECAAALGVTVATFDVVLLRAVRAFRAKLGGRIAEEP